MEHREDGLMVDYSPDLTRTSSPKQEREMSSLGQESALMKAMNEIRQYQPKTMTTAQREKFAILCENIFRKHGITPETYQQYFGHLGTQGQLRRA